MQVQLQLLIADQIPLGPGGGGVPPGPTFYLLTEDSEFYITEDGDKLRQE